MKILTVIYSYWRWILSILTISLCIASAVGIYQYVQYKKQENFLNAASHQYERLIQPTQGNNSLIPLHEARLFLQAYKKTPYAGLLQLKLAKQAVNNQQFAEAIKWLKCAAEEATELEIQCIAKQRGARILATMGKLKEALQFIEDMPCESYHAATEELKGDMFQALGDKVKALQAYQKSYKLFSYLPERKALVAIKINDLGSV